jgi:hypothetical protein
VLEAVEPRVAELRQLAASLQDSPGGECGVHCTALHWASL